MPANMVGKKSAGDGGEEENKVVSAPLDSLQRNSSFKLLSKLWSSFVSIQDGHYLTSFAASFYYPFNVHIDQW